jgi:hypothetical protein
MVQGLTVTVFLFCFGLQVAMAEMALGRQAALSAAAGRDQPLTLGALEISRALVAAWGHGDAWAGLRHARLARERGEAVRDARQVAFAHVFVGTSLWSLGQLVEAEAELRLAAAGDDLIASAATLWLGLVLIERGALDEARAIAQRRIDTGRSAAARLGALREAEGHWLLGEIAVREGDLASGEREILAGAEVLRPAGLIWRLAAARLVDIRLRRGAVADALALATDLVGALTASGGHGLRGTLVRLLHAEALRASRDLPTSRAAIRAAGDDLHARASRIDDPAARALFLAVPENARVLALSREWLGA